MCRFINADEISYLGANGDMQGFNLYAYCSNNPVMYTDPNGNSVILVLSLIIDTVVETCILMTGEKYRAESVFEGDDVEIPKSCLFNNPIAQLIYSKYLYENVKNKDGTPYFQGDVYDIVGEWQMHNFVFWAPIALLTSGDLGTTAIGAGLTYYLHSSTQNANIGSSIETENNGLRKYTVYYPSQVFKWLNKIGTFDILNWW